MSESGVIQLAFSVAWKLFATKASEALDTGDIADEKIRQLLLSEFQKIHEHLDALRRKELVAAVAFLETGFELLDKDTAASKDEFKKARDAAQMAMGVVQSADDKLLATKILIASSVHEFHDRPETRKTLCLKYIARLNSLPEVCKACACYYDPKSTSMLNRASTKLERQNLVRNIAEINACGYDFLTQCEDRKSLLACWPPIALPSRQLHAIHDLVLFRRNRTIAVLDKGHSSVVDAVICDSKIFAAAGQSCEDSVKHTIACIDIATGGIKYLVGHTHIVLSLVVKDKFVCSGSYDKTVMIWDSITLECVHVLNESAGSVRTLCASSKALLVGSSDGNVRSYLTGDFKCNHVYECKSPVSHITCSQQKFLFVLTAQQTIQIWDMTKSAQLQDVKCPNNCSRLIASDNLLFCLACGPLHAITLGSLQIHKQPLPVMTEKIALNGTNRLLVSGGQTMSMWDVRHWKCTWKDDIYYKADKVAKIGHVWFHDGFLYAFCEIKDGAVVVMQW